MELKKVSSAGDPDVVKRNKQRIDPIAPCIIAVSIQLMATVYLYSVSAPTRSIVASGVLTLVYLFVSYLLIKPGKKPQV